MIRADRYVKDTLNDLVENGTVDENPRAKWQDGTPAHSVFTTQKVFNYDISNGEFPITTLRTTALKGAFYDIEAIYIKQTNILEEMHPSIRNWWKDFTTYVDEKKNAEDYIGKIGIGELIEDYEYQKYHSLGNTYGAIIKKYDLMNKLLKGLEENPFGRRNMIDMWQYSEQISSPKSLVPCAFMTMWSVRDEKWESLDVNSSEVITNRCIDLTLIQRSQDFLMTMSINPAQYVMLGMMVCNHLTFKTGVKHSLGNFMHVIQNLHIYDHPSHWGALLEMSERNPIHYQPTMELICEPKDFYDHTIEDFKFVIPEGIQKLKNKLELAI